MSEEDELDFQKHEAREILVAQYQRTFGLTERQAWEDFVIHAENHPLTPVFTTAAGKPRKRPRKIQEEVRA